MIEHIFLSRVRQFIRCWCCHCNDPHFHNLHRRHYNVIMIAITIEILAFQTASMYWVIGIIYVDIIIVYITILIIIVIMIITINIIILIITIEARVLAF